MKVLGFHADENGGVGFYRMREPARVAADSGVDVTITDGVDADISLNEGTGMMKVNEIFTDADLIVIQRPLRQVWTSLIEQAKRQGIATIVEIDDDYDFIHRSNLAYLKEDPASTENPYWLRQAAKAADHVTVSTPALLKYGARATVLRNCVPESALSLQTGVQHKKPVIGWTGTTQTHPHDLQETRGGVGDVIRKNSLQLGIVGDGEDVRRFLGLHWESPMSVTGWVPLEDYYTAIQASMSIGIVPLELSQFNQAKSALKGLEMAALGIPFVASPTREYLRLEAYGLGKTAKSPGDWRRHLQRLLDRPEETERISKQYRETIYNESMTYEASAHQWVAVWEQAVDYRKSHHG